MMRQEEKCVGMSLNHGFITVSGHPESVFTAGHVNRGHSISTHLHEAVANQTHQQLLPPALSDQRGVLSAVHAREVKHGHVRLARVALHKLEVGQFATCAEVGRVVGIVVQSLIIHVCGSQQLVCVAAVLQGRSAR